VEKREELQIYYEAKRLATFTSKKKNERITTHVDII
jgi:hypothetical protein